MIRVASITPDEYVKKWPTTATHEDVVLLDVREHEELQVAALPFAKHCPMGQIPGRISELDATKTFVVMCHSGFRSMQVAAYLAGHGFERVMNLTGGIDAWSREVDPALPRY
jgi:rhodanese-related sulfurtransferase